MKNKIILVVGIVIILATYSCTSQTKTSSISTVADTSVNIANNHTIPAEYDKIYTEVERTTFQYFWDGAEPNSGMARERFHVDNVYPENDKHIVTVGGGGFGVMAILVGINRGFITRQQGLERLQRIVGFLEKADRFHGAWPHWLNGETGKVKPFGQKDNGGDLVETSFMIQGLLAVRQYFAKGNEQEKALAEKIDKLWKEVDFNWYRNGKNVLYWHWSPDYEWQMNFPVTGYNECLIMYVLGASSPTHGIPAEVYHQGWAKSGKLNGETTKYGHTLHFVHNDNPAYGGPLFWSHYSYLGLDPRGLKDKYADYWNENKNHTLINHDWCVENPRSIKVMARIAGDLLQVIQLMAMQPMLPELIVTLGVISPTAALSSMPYTPEYSMQAMKHWYQDLGDKIYGTYGFYDAFSETDNWFPKRYLAIDQGPIVVMMENYRTGLLWNLFMSSPEVQQGLKKLGFESPHLKY
jgi:hypothetical protein